MKIVWVTNSVGKVFVDNTWIANVHKDRYGNITLH